MEDILYIRWENTEKKNNYIQQNDMIDLMILMKKGSRELYRSQIDQLWDENWEFGPFLRKMYVLYFQ